VHVSCITFKWRTPHITNTSFDAYVWQTLHTLQWGHAFVSVETADAQLLILRA